MSGTRGLLANASTPATTASRSIDCSAHTVPVGDCQERAVVFWQLETRQAGTNGCAARGRAGPCAPLSKGQILPVAGDDACCIAHRKDVA